MYINNRLSGIDAKNGSYIEPSGFTPIINPSAINYKDQNINDNKAIGRPTPNPPMSLVPGMTSPNWDWSYLGFYRRQLENQQTQKQLQGISTTDILDIVSNPTLDNIKAKVKTPQDVQDLITQANLLGIKLDPSLLSVLNAVKDQGSPGDVDNSGNGPVKIEEKNEAQYLLYGVGALAVIGIGYVIFAKPKGRRK